MRKQIIPLLSALSFCLMVLLMELIPIWEPHSSAASQDKPAAEIAAAIEEQKQEAANMARSRFVEQKFQELSAKANMDGTVSVIVRLRVAFRPEGDMPSAAGIQAQRAVIAQSRDSLMKEISGYDPASLTRFEYTPYVAVKVKAAGLEELRQSPNVIDIHRNEILRPALFRSVPLIGAPVEWENGHTGAGKTVAVLDTGVAKAHRFIAGKVVSEACYSTTNADEHAASLCPGGVSESTAADSGLNCNVSNDCDHGTHVAGIAAGNGEGTGNNFSGVAKDANIISIQVFSQINDSSECAGGSPCVRSFTSDVMKALERVYTLRDSHSVASVNLSLEGGRFTSNCDTNPLKSIIDQLRSAGIATVAASGNDGYTNAISQPACVSSVISVGATKFGGFEVSESSNSASFLTMLAPGDFITSSVPNGFTTAFGTSTAAPHVAGAWAILKQRTPTAGVTEILNYLTSRGVPITDSRNGITLPRLNLGPPPECVAANVHVNRWKGEYFDNTDLAGAPALSRDDGDGFLDFNFGVGGPSSTCNVGDDNFSARWSRRVDFPAGTYRFTVTGDDGVRLYIDGRLRIDKWLIQPPTTYTVDVFLSSGSHAIKLEYFESGGGATVGLSWENLIGSPCYADVPSNHWKGEYFNFAGDALMISDDGAGFLDFDFGDGGPNSACGVGADNFSVRWSRQVSFAPGTYRFTVTADDGVRLLFNGGVILDRWRVQAASTYTIERYISGGQIMVGLEYFELSGNAVAKLSWELLSPDCFAPVPSHHWKGEYYSNTSLDGPAAMIRDDGPDFLNFDIGTDSPSATCGPSADNFSVRWSRKIRFTTPGAYRFTITGDDGVRFYIGDPVFLDKWVTQSPTTYTLDVIVAALDYDVRLEYFDSGGGALARVSWEKLPDNCFTSVPLDHWQGDYFNNTNLEGPPVMTRNDGPNFLNFNVGADSPSATCGVAADNFSARWLRWFDFAPGVYRFTVTGDDGVRLYVGGRLIIDKWVIQAPTTYTADMSVSAGKYPIVLEYFENLGGAQASVSWERLPDP